MPVKINLLKNRHTLSEGEYKKERAYYQYSVFGIVIAVILTLGISIWQFVLTTTLSRLEAKITKSSQELVGLSEANAKQIYLKSRLKLITKFLDDRSVARQSVQQIFSLNIPGVTVSGASFESDSVISMQAKADNVLAFQKLLDYFENGNDFFLHVVNKGITRSEDGTYTMQISLTIPKG